MEARRSHLEIEIANLPEDIIEDIILRLPVKSLLKFKCVSKSWLSLISSPRFVKAHLGFSSGRGADLTNHGVMIASFCKDSSWTIQQCLISSLISGGPIYESYTTPRTDVRILDSCNGIICYVLSEAVDDVFLWNPSTRKLKKLPPIDDEARRRLDYIWGFGYIESEDNYKVVGICESVVKIYSLRTDSWKRIEDLSYAIEDALTGIVVSGKFHLKATSSTIMSLDLKTEDYGIVEQPDFGRNFTTLGAIGGYLSIIRERKRKVKKVKRKGKKVKRMVIEVWVMKEYGVKESWTRIFGFPYPDPYDVNGLLLMPNGEYLLVSETALTVYKSKGNPLEPVISNLKNFEEATMYVESLVPL